MTTTDEAAEARGYTADYLTHSTDFDVRTAARESEALLDEARRCARHFPHLAAAYRDKAALSAAAALRDLLDADDRARERQPNRTVNECLSALRETLI